MIHIGLGGVDDEENPRAVLWGKRLEWPMLLLAIWIILDWYLKAKGISVLAETGSSGMPAPGTVARTRFRWPGEARREEFAR